MWEQKTRSDRSTQIQYYKEYIYGRCRCARTKYALLLRASHTIFGQANEMDISSVQLQGTLHGVLVALCCKYQAHKQVQWWFRLNVAWMLSRHFA